MIEGFKFISQALGIFCLTAEFLMFTMIINPWQIIQFFKKLIFTVVGSGDIVMETFFAFSAFFASYRLLQVNEVQGTLFFSDYAKMWGRKFLRLAPVFYFVFFVGWAIFPYMGAGPIWYNSNLMYEECSKYWWAQLLFISNLYPNFQAPNEGCFFWSYIIEVDLQLALFIPLFIAVYRRNDLAGHIFAFFSTVVCVIGSLYTCNKYGLRAGTLAYENWNMFTFTLQKPWCHLTSMIIGVYGAWLYMELKKYRKVTDEVKAKEYPILHAFHKKAWLKMLLFTVGMLLIGACLTASFTAL